MEELQKWKLDSVGYQQTFYERFGDRDWDLIPRMDTNSLNTKISYTLYGKPFEICDLEEVKCVEDTRNKILELNGSGDVSFACVFICVLLKKCKEPFIFSLIRIKKTYGNDFFFVERQPGRVYTGFNDFLKNNKLPKCDMCFPQNGFYKAHDSRVNVRFQESPSCSLTFKVLDVVSFVGKAASTGLLAASSFFPIIAPIMIASSVVLGGTTAYATTRGIVHLVDRDKHHQPISPVNGDARKIWLEMANDIIGSVLAGGAAALPRLMAGGRLVTAAAATILDVISWVSLGVNSFGVVTNIVTLVMKYRSGKLVKSDIDIFITSCLFIGNLILSATIANHIIRELSERPSQLYRMFKMTTNTSFQIVKITSPCVSIEAAIETLCGHSAETFFTYFDMSYTSSLVKGVRNILKQFKNDNNAPQIYFELFKLLTNHLQQCRTEIKDASQKINKFCGHLANQKLSVNGEVLFRNSQVMAPEVVRGVENVVENLSIHDQTINDNLACSLMKMKLAVDLGRETSVRNEQQFADVCRILMNDVKSRCDRKLVLLRAENRSATTCDKQMILIDVVRELRNEIKTQTLFPAGVEQAKLLSDEILLRPLYKIENFDAYTFEVSPNFGVLDQFLNDAACKLFHVDVLPENTFIHCDNERTMVMRMGNKTLVFFYERQPDATNILGLALMALEEF